MARNDPLLEPLIRADEARRQEEVERLIGIVQPLLAGVLARYPVLTPQETEDVAAEVNLRLVEKLRRIPSSADDAVQHFDKYAAMVAYNAIKDHLRAQNPERTRLRKSLRHQLTHDPRLAIWPCTTGQACGLAGWDQPRIVAGEVELDPARITAAMRESSRPGEALVAILTAIGHPLTFNALEDLVEKIWEVVDVVHEDIARVSLADNQPSAAEQLEWRQFLETLWREIRQLRPVQRKALLLNLRDDRTVNVLSLLALTGTAKFDDIAAALEMSAGQLAAIWNDLPLDDLRIAEMLGTNRQQVINFRKAARRRLTKATKWTS